MLEEVWKKQNQCESYSPEKEVQKKTRTNNKEKRNNGDGGGGRVGWTGG